MFPVTINYAEIHFRYPFLKSKYYRDLPEIITDIPYRLSTKQIPILLIVKDADLFPITIDKITIFIKSRNSNFSSTISVDIYSDQDYFSKIFYYDLPDKISEDQFINIDIKIKCHTKNKIYIFLNDNYLTLKRKSFSTYFANKKFPYPKNWYAGEAHFHSNYTNDQVEFGSDIYSTSIMAKTIGLDWFFVTDHSYDLDDCIDDYSKNDSAIPKWYKMWETVEKYSSEEMKIIGGEEVSIGNTSNRNVHLLHLNSKKFIEGYGDSGDSFIHKNPTHSITNLEHLGDDNSLFIAAHPFEKIPISQKIILKRGEWEIKDFISSEVKFVQAINSNLEDDIFHGIKKWEELLFRNFRAILIAGNDSHGNFNYMKQIKIPFLKLFISRKQIFGKFQTVFHYGKNSPIDGLKKRNIIVSNGPFLSFYLESNGGKFPIGSEIDFGNYTLKYEAKTSEEFGKIKKIKLIFGTITNSKKRIIINPPNNYKFQIKENSFIRMELLTNKLGMVFTNPIWTKLNT